VFLGAELEKAFTAIETGSGDAATPQAYLGLGASVLPQLPMHGGDRNRTSPFAFTGNKFEFRALGSSQSLGLPNTVLNTIAAEAIDELAERVEQQTSGGASVEEAVLAAVRDAWSANKQVVFGGDNYSDEWHAEAERRGLLNLRTTPDALPCLTAPATISMFERYEVLNEREIEARFEVLAEQYATAINIEAETAAQIARTMLLPATISYLTRVRAAGAGEGLSFLADEASGLLDRLVAAIRELEKANVGHPNSGDVLIEAGYARDTVVPAMDGVREVADQLERIVPDDLWPLPKYSEILFIK
jgi:glutamine synthetase